ncbi:hypothetical protein JCM17823_06270 [Halorubrum gandharaense]
MRRNHEGNTGIQLRTGHRKAGEFAVSKTDVETIFDNFDGFPRSLEAPIGCTEKGIHVFATTFSREFCVIKFFVDCREITSKLD